MLLQHVFAKRCVCLGREAVAHLASEQCLLGPPYCRMIQSIEILLDLSFLGLSALADLWFVAAEVRIRVHMLQVVASGRLLLLW